MARAVARLNPIALLVGRVSHDPDDGQLRVLLERRRDGVDEGRHPGTGARLPDAK